MYNTLLENIILPLTDKAIGSVMMNKLRYYRKVHSLPKADLEKLQQEKLRDMLQFAKKNIPFYSNINFDPSADPMQEIRKFPVMRKPVIKQNIDSLLSRPKDGLIKEASSGSSGIQGIVYLDKDAQSSQRAVQMFWWEGAGFKFGNSILQTGITPNRGKIKGWKDKLLNTKYVSAYNLDESQVVEILKDLEKNPRQHFMGYASSLYVFAKVAREHGINNVRFQSAVSWGDKLFPHFRELIEKQFNTRVHDTYGCTEGAMMAAQCSEMNYHLNTPQVYIEILDDNDNPVPYGEMGKVVVTRLDNFAMPLIRYYLGDLAILEDPSVTCACGRKTPLLRKIIGRDTDIVKTRSNKYMVVHAFTGIFEHIGEVKQFRVIQRTLDEIEVEYIPDRGFGEQVLEHIERKIHGHLHEAFPVIFREVDHIPSTPSGKPQIIQSFLK